MYAHSRSARFGSVGVAEGGLYVSAQSVTAASRIHMHCTDLGGGAGDYYNHPRRLTSAVRRAQFASVCDREGWNDGAWRSSKQASV